MFKCVFILVFLFGSVSPALLEVASGYNSFSAGHNTPELTVGGGGDSWLVSASSAGFRTKAYYHSNYVLRYYKTWEAGDFFWGKMSFGAGGGVVYAVRGFKDGTANEETASDFVLGPAIRAKWNFAGPVFLALDGLFGVGQFWQLLALNAQDSVSFSVGVSTW